MTDPNDKRSRQWRPTEAVRIIGVAGSREAIGGAGEADEPTGSLPTVGAESTSERSGPGAPPPTNTVPTGTGTGSTSTVLTGRVPTGSVSASSVPTGTASPGGLPAGPRGDGRSRRSTRRQPDSGATLQPARLRWASETPADPETGAPRAAGRPVAPGDEVWAPDPSDVESDRWARPAPAADPWGLLPGRDAPVHEEQTSEAFVPEPSDPPVGRREGPRRQDRLGRTPEIRPLGSGAVGRLSGSSAFDQGTGRVPSGSHRAVTGSPWTTLGPQPDPEPEPEPEPGQEPEPEPEPGQEPPSRRPHPEALETTAGAGGTPPVGAVGVPARGAEGVADPEAFRYDDQVADDDPAAEDGDPVWYGGDFLGHHAPAQDGDAYAEGDETTDIHAFVTFGDHDEEDPVIENHVLDDTGMDEPGMDEPGMDEPGVVAAPTGRTTRRTPRLRRRVSGPEPVAAPANGASAVGRRGSRLRRGGPDDADGSRSKRDLRSRVIVGAAIAVLFIIAYIIGPKALLVLAAVVVLLCAAEAYSMLLRCGFRPATLLGLAATGGLMFAAYWRGEPAVPLVMALAFGATMIWYLLGIVDARPLANVAVSTMTIVWVGLLGSFAALMLRVPHGKGLFLGAVIVTVACDVVAFFAGRRWGSHALAPSVSPGKTVEGFLAGALAAVVVGVIIGETVSPWGGLAHGLLLGIAVAIFAPVGDLFESLIKRDLEVKDSGTVLAGHGGLLDRFDSVLLVLPVTYYLADYLHLLK